MDAMATCHCIHTHPYMHPYIHTCSHCVHTSGEVKIVEVIMAVVVEKTMVTVVA